MSLTYYSHIKGFCPPGFGATVVPLHRDFTNCWDESLWVSRPLLKVFGVNKLLKKMGVFECYKNKIY